MKPESHALYRFYGDTGQLLYVGITNDPARRFGQHAAKKHWWRAVRGISLEWYSSRDDAIAAEKRAIAIERPMTNIVRPEMAAPEWKCNHCSGCEDGTQCRGNLAPRACSICKSTTCAFTAGAQEAMHRIADKVQACASVAELIDTLKAFLGPGAMGLARCGHCGGCLDGRHCVLFDGPSEDEDAECGPCDHCGQDTCLYGLGWGRGYKIGRAGGREWALDLHRERIRASLMLEAVIDGPIEIVPESLRVGI